MKITLPDIESKTKLKIFGFCMMFAALMHDTGSIIVSVFGSVAFVYFAGIGLKWAATTDLGNRPKD